MKRIRVSMEHFTVDLEGLIGSYALDCSKLRALGWVPKVGFESGITQTVRWYPENAATWSASLTGEFSAYLEHYASRLAPAP